MSGGIGMQGSNGGVVVDGLLELVEPGVVVWPPGRFGSVSDGVGSVGTGIDGRLGAPPVVSSPPGTVGTGTPVPPPSPLPGAPGTSVPWSPGTVVPPDGAVPGAGWVPDAGSEPG